ncbi:hypothetical protein FOB64_003895 [Candida albicans]|uniref:Uncharacterized protein n=1 Tax=Candida albicans TaxID=5476 RepID=A0A8H6BX36_CANAX|nr:hypothetical protein FOB64_003895 [Candida albicans]
MPDGIYNNEPFTIIKREIMGGVPCYTIEYEKGGCQTLQEETLERYAPDGTMYGAAFTIQSREIVYGLVFYKIRYETGVYDTIAEEVIKFQAPRAIKRFNSRKKN